MQKNAKKSIFHSVGSLWWYTILCYSYNSMSWKLVSIDGIDSKVWTKNIQNVQNTITIYCSPLRNICKCSNLVQLCFSNGRPFRVKRWSRYLNIFCVLLKIKKNQLSKLYVSNSISLLSSTWHKSLVFSGQIFKILLNVTKKHNVLKYKSGFWSIEL